ncbi:hypothetical protein [Nostoc sp.]|uniref:hypothetical protein n=1 Tax=Nostoc sp. TaxID=1180 RepID=UPI002FFA23F6
MVCTCTLSALTIAVLNCLVRVAFGTLHLSILQLLPFSFPQRRIFNLSFNFLGYEVWDVSSVNCEDEELVWVIDTPWMESVRRYSPNEVVIVGDEKRMLDHQR